MMLRRSAAVAAVMMSAVAAAAVRLPSGPAVAAAQPDPAVSVTDLAPDWWRGHDLLVDGHGDENGYHLSVALEREQYAARALATIQPGGAGDDAWLGYQCLTGDRRFVVAAVAPRSAVNSAVLRDRGALVYSVEIASGRVRPILRGAAFKEHALNCGAGSRAAVVRHLGADQERSEVVRIDAAAGTATRVAAVTGQLTWPVPDGAGALALQGRAVVRVRAGRTAGTRVVSVEGEPFRLTAAGDGRTDLLVRRADRVEVRQVTGAATRLLGSGPAGRVGLWRAPAGRSVVTGADRVEVADGFRTAGAQARTARAISAEGRVLLGAAAVAGAAHHGGSVASETRRLFATDGRSLKTAEGTDVSTAIVGEASAPAVTAVPAAPEAAAAVPAPTCGVPRNDPRRQAYSSTPAQSAWAVQMASRNLLTGSRGRPANYLNTGLAAYSPSTDFPVPPLSPVNGAVPSAVMNGILAQESAYRHASWRVLRGTGGNPLVGNYYGVRDSIDQIDYSKSDCGYGIAQVTTGMRAAETSISANGKAKVAVDYAENIQAGLQILAQKWNQTTAAGIRMNNADPAGVENWYFALWAYNSGVNPQASTGGTSGCTPGPGCTDAAGQWGLGWTNNPMNPDYPPDRDVFLRATYADAEHPSDWPYQERVLGWAETPLEAGFWGLAYAKVSGGPSGIGTVSYPDRTLFCTAANNCSPDHDAAGTDHDFCRDTAWHCWWHDPITFLDCRLACSRSEFTAAATSTEPARDNPWNPTCDSDLGSGAVIVDDLANPAQNLFCPARNWGNGGTFTLSTASTDDGVPLGEIDLHQAATGFGAHTWFAGNRTAGDLTHLVTGTWTPNALATGSYVIKVHIPVAGASAGSARYQITASDGTVHTRIIDQHEHYNHWKSLGLFQLGPNAKVHLTNITRDDTTGGVNTVAYDSVAFVPVTGTYLSKDVDASAIFSPDQSLDTPLAGWLDSPMTSNQAVYDWADRLTSTTLALPACTGAPAVGCLAPATRKAMQDWRALVTAAGTDPVNHPPGKSLAGWLKVANDPGFVPTGATRPAAQETDPDSYKIRSRMTLSMVVAADGTIVPGSADVDYRHATGNTHLPQFVLDLMAALTTDYGIAPPNLNYTAANLWHYDHKNYGATPRLNGVLPGRAYKFGGIRPELRNSSGAVVTSGGSCVSGLYISGGAIGFRAMLHSGAVPPSVYAWKERVRATATVPTVVSGVAAEVYNLYFRALGVLPPGGSPFTMAAPIWQELRAQLCADGTVKKVGNTPILRASHMPDQYLWLDGSAIDNNGARRATAAPLWRGNFYSFSLPNAPAGPVAGPYGGCGTNTGQNGNPWNLDAAPFADELRDNPDHVHFCLDPSIPLDAERSG